jgi:hypothetical protein
MDRTLHGWAIEFGEINKNWLGMFEADVINDYKRIDDYSLPTYHKKFFEVELLLKDTKSFIDNYDFVNCYIQLYPKNAALKKYNKMNITSPEEILEFINEKIEKYYKNYFILISEFEPNLYGGSIMSNGSKIYLEMCGGLQNQIAYGTTKTIGYAISETNVKTFSNATEKEKIIMDNVIGFLELNSIPDQDKYLKGYFEFAITIAVDGVNPRIVFFDFKDDASYYNI